MTWDALFSATSTLAFAGWALLILGPLGLLFGLMTETATRALRRGRERGMA
jgi:hypothetical protein